MALLGTLAKVFVDFGGFLIGRFWSLAEDGAGDVFIVLGYDEIEHVHLAIGVELGAEVS